MWDQVISIVAIASLLTSQVATQYFKHKESQLPDPATAIVKYEEVNRQAGNIVAGFYEELNEFYLAKQIYDLSLSSGSFSIEYLEDFIPPEAVANRKKVIVALLEHNSILLQLAAFNPSPELVKEAQAANTNLKMLVDNLSEVYFGTDDLAKFETDLTKKLDDWQQKKNTATSPDARKEFTDKITHAQEQRSLLANVKNAKVIMDSLNQAQVAVIGYLNKKKRNQAVQQYIRESNMLTASLLQSLKDDYSLHLNAIIDRNLYVLAEESAICYSTFFKGAPVERGGRTLDPLQLKIMYLHYLHNSYDCSLSHYRSSLEQQQQLQLSREIENYYHGLDLALAQGELNAYTKYLAVPDDPKSCDSYCSYQFILDQIELSKGSQWPEFKKKLEAINFIYENPFLKVSTEKDFIKNGRVPIRQIRELVQLKRAFQETNPSTLLDTAMATHQTLVNFAESGFTPEEKRQMSLQILALEVQNKVVSEQKKGLDQVVENYFK